MYPVLHSKSKIATQEPDNPPNKVIVIDVSCIISYFCSTMIKTPGKSTQKKGNTFYFTISQGSAHSLLVPCA